MTATNGEKKKILFVVEAMGGGIFTYIVDLANELCKKYDMYIVYGIRRQTPKNYLNYFDPSIHMIFVKDFTREISQINDLRAFTDIKKIEEEIKPDIIHLYSSKAGVVGRLAFDGKRIPLFYAPHGYSFLMQNYKPLKRMMFKIYNRSNNTTFKIVGDVCAFSSQTFNSPELILFPFNEICEDFSIESGDSRRAVA